MILLAFYVDVGNILQKDVEKYIEDLSVKFKQEHEENNIKAYYIPVRNQESRVEFLYAGPDSDNNTHSDIKDICNQYRQQGYTTWLLRSAIWNPNVIILCNTMKTSKHLEFLYNKLLSELPWYKKVLRRFIVNRKIKPIFTSDIDSLRGMRKPFIFDNSYIMYVN